MTVVTRFAPSPTGRLHLGHAYAAILAHAASRDACGRFLLRIEDIDSGRCRQEYIDGIEEDLRWLGLDWDGAARRQSAHAADYRAVLAALRARELIYPCFCTRGDIAAALAAPHEGCAGAGRDPYGAPLYPGTCRAQPDAARKLAAGLPHAWRLDMARAVAEAGEGLFFVEQGYGNVACAPGRFGDVVLGRKDCPVSYHLCVTHDDAVQGVTLVTRGEDLRPATDVHRLLQALMGWDAPSYRHHALLTDSSGRRLAKRDEEATLASLRANGRTAAEVRAMATARAQGR
jgi:glutamyl-Q tRNA(Asp) synthetase